MNYQSLSSFGSDYAYSWFQLLHEYLCTLTVKIYAKGYSYAETLLNALRTYYKQASLFINLECFLDTISERVSYATGETLGNVTYVGLTFKQTPIKSKHYKANYKGGRGYIVTEKKPSLIGTPVKVPKYLTPSKNNLNILDVRLYSTRSSLNIPETVQDQSEKIPKGLFILAKH